MRIWTLTLYTVLVVVLGGSAVQDNVVENGNAYDGTPSTCIMQEESGTRFCTTTKAASTGDTLVGETLWSVPYIPTWEAEAGEGCWVETKNDGDTEKICGDWSHRPLYT